MSQSSSPPPTAVQRVPVGRTMRAAYAAVFGSLGLLLKAAALPFLLSLAIIGLSLTAAANPLPSFILVLAGFVPYTLFGVAWHRLTLLGPTEGAPVAFPSWRRRHWRFLGYVAIMTGVIYSLSAPFAIAVAKFSGNGTQGLALILLLLVVAVIVALPYLTMRVSFVFPAAAVDEEYTLRNAWAHTHGQGFRLLATLIATALPMLAVIWFVNTLLGALLLPDIVANTQDVGMSPQNALRQAVADHAVAFSLAQLALAALNYIVMALMVSAVSIAFRQCTGWVPAPPPTQGRLGEENGEGS